MLTKSAYLKTMAQGTTHRAYIEGGLYKGGYTEGPMHKGPYIHALSKPKVYAAVPFSWQPPEMRWTVRYREGRSYKWRFFALWSDAMAFATIDAAWFAFREGFAE